MFLLKSRFCCPAPSGCARRAGGVISHRSADVTGGSPRDAPVPNATPGFTLCLQNGPALPGSDEGILEQEVSAVGSLRLFQDHSAGGSSESKEGTSGPGQGGGSASSLRAAPCSWAASEKRAADRGPPGRSRGAIVWWSHFLCSVQNSEEPMGFQFTPLPFYSAHFMGHVFPHCPASCPQKWAALCGEDSLNPR